MYGVAFVDVKIGVSVGIGVGDGKSIVVGVGDGLVPLSIKAVVLVGTNVRSEVTIMQNTTTMKIMVIIRRFILFLSNICSYLILIFVLWHVIDSLDSQ